MRKLVMVLVAGVLGAALAAAPPAGASTLRHGPDHRITHSTSTNWAGYAAINGTYTSVSSSWTQPTATCAKGETSYSSFWVGLDGYSSNSVEQDGTDADCANGTPTYYAWYEMYPKYPVNLSSSKYPVRPGDQLTASVVNTSGSSFTLTIADATQHWSYSTVQKHKSALSSAEVIAEAPSSASGVLPLTNFGTASFSGATANGQALSTFNPDKIDMVSGSTTKATTSALSGGSFSVAWKHS